MDKWGHPHHFILRFTWTVNVDLPQQGYSFWFIRSLFALHIFLVDTESTIKPLRAQINGKRVNDSGVGDIPLLHRANTNVGNTFCSRTWHWCRLVFLIKNRNQFCRSISVFWAILRSGDLLIQHGVVTNALSTSSIWKRIVKFRAKITHSL